MLKLRFLLFFTVVSASISAARGELLIHYTFDEGSGVTAADSAGGNNNATFSTAPVWTADMPPVPGGNVSAVALADMNSTLSTPDDDALDALPKFTVAMWIKNKPDGFEGALRRNYPRLMEKMDSAGKGLVIHANVPSNYLQIWMDSKSTKLYYTGAELAGWHHWAVTYDRTAASNNANLYIDGELKTSSNFTQIAGGNADGLDVASTTLLAENAMSNIIDDFRFCNEALSQSQVRALIPEPGSWMLLLAGLLSLPAIRLRK